MKNVLLATTALVAMAGAASAEVTWAGATDLGFNDDIQGGFYLDGNMDLTASVDLGDNVTATLTYGLDWENNNDLNDINATRYNDVTDLFYFGAPTAFADDDGMTWDAFPTIKIESSIGSLTWGDLNDGGASEMFYEDRDGMTRDVENHDSDTNPGFVAVLNYSSFSVSAGCAGLVDAVCDGYNYGAAASFAGVDLAVGYDDAANGAQTTAVSADYTMGALSMGVSYASATGATQSYRFDANAGGFDPRAASGSTKFTGPAYNETSLGLVLGYDVTDAINLGAYYANNSVAGDSYGVSATYTSGPLAVKAYFDQTAGYGYSNAGGTDADADGFLTGGVWTLAASSADAYGIDVSYEAMENLEIFAGYLDSTDASVDQGAYVGATYTVNDSISATLSYAEADEINGPEYMAGTSLFISASF